MSEDKAKQTEVPKRSLLGDMLIEKRIITRDQLDYALKVQRGSNQKLGRMLVDIGYVEEEQIINVLMDSVVQENRKSVPIVEKKDLSELEKMVDPSLLPRYNINFCKQHELMPICLEDDGKRIVVAMLDPKNLDTLHELRFISNIDIRPLRIDPRELRQLWRVFYGEEEPEEQEDNENKLMAQIGLQDMVPRVYEKNVPQFLDAIFLQAVNYKVSDIHMDPWRDSVIVRFRIDGVLYPVVEISPKIYKPLVSRIKVLANMDISEHRQPQEGRIELDHPKIKRSVHLRVACIPTHFGERVAVRILDSGGVKHDLEALGMGEQDIESFKKVLNSPRGVILITGPTGSGKTTTLYSMLNDINDLTRNIMTIEDPVEYLTHGIGQIQIHEKAGISYASVLRHLLRQNPDVVLVGEIRDPETAEIVVRASLTGHLIISTVHTDDTASAVSRMLDLGVEPYLLAPAMSLVVSQRLVRRICPGCRKEVYPSVRDQLRAGLRPMDVDKIRFYEGEGCKSCAFTGYKGVTGVYEVMLMNKAIRDRIMQRAPAVAIRSLALRHGMVTLRDHALDKAKKGEISLVECLRVGMNV